MKLWVQRINSNESIMSLFANKVKLGFTNSTIWDVLIKYGLHIYARTGFLPERWHPSERCEFSITRMDTKRCRAASTGSLEYDELIGLLLDSIFILHTQLLENLTEVSIIVQIIHITMRTVCLTGGRGRYMTS